jgi:hypothetical protein
MRGLSGEAGVAERYLAKAEGDSTPTGWRK